MSKTLHCVVDPLCGWCYGAGALLHSLAAHAATHPFTLRLLPSGLFAGEGARPMDDDFAHYAWDNDQRIERLTGQRFTERYRQQVLADRRQRFDSGPATLALTAVALSAPQRELDALDAIQQARYVEGRDITQPDTLAAVLGGLGLAPAAALLERPEAGLLAANQERVAQAQALLRPLGARGVPAFVLDAGGPPELLPAGLLFSSPQAFAERITAA